MESETICHYCGEKLPHEKCSEWKKSEPTELTKKARQEWKDTANIHSKPYSWCLEACDTIDSLWRMVNIPDLMKDGFLAVGQELIKRDKEIDCLTAENKLYIYDTVLLQERLRQSSEQWSLHCEQLQAKLNAKDDVLRKIKDWCRAYPLEAFPKPDKEYFAKAHAILKQNELSLTRISADNMRHILVRIQKIIEGEAKDV